MQSTQILNPYSAVHSSIEIYLNWKASMHNLTSDFVGILNHVIEITLVCITSTNIFNTCTTCKGSHSRYTIIIIGWSLFLWKTSSYPPGAIRTIYAICIQWNYTRNYRWPTYAIYNYPMNPKYYKDWDNHSHYMSTTINMTWGKIMMVDISQTCSFNHYHSQTAHSRDVANPFSS